MLNNCELSISMICIILILDTEYHYIYYLYTINQLLKNCLVKTIILGLKGLKNISSIFFINIVI